MSYFEAHDFHSAERRDRKEKYGEGFEKWKEENILRTQEIINKQLSGEKFSDDDVKFLLEQTVENVNQKWATGEQFFMHHFDRIRIRQKELEMQEKLLKLAHTYRKVLSNIRYIDKPLFNNKSLDIVVEEARKTLEDTKIEYRWIKNRTEECE